MLSFFGALDPAAHYRGRNHEPRSPSSNHEYMLSRRRRPRREDGDRYLTVRPDCLGLEWSCLDASASSSTPLVEACPGHGVEVIAKGFAASGGAAHACSTGSILSRIVAAGAGPVRANRRSLLARRLRAVPCARYSRQSGRTSTGRPRSWRTATASTAPEPRWRLKAGKGRHWHAGRNPSQR